MAWIEVHQSLVSHKKTMALCDALAIEPAHAVGHLVCLWTWSIDNAPHGDLSGVQPATIARAAGWPRNRTQQLLDALVQSGFLECADERLRIHDFEDYIGKLIARREANVLRTRAARSHHVTRTKDSGVEDVTRTKDSGVEDVTRTKDSGVEDVTRTNGVGNGATQPDTTQHNRTQPDHPPGPPPVRDANGVLDASCCTKFAATGRQHLASCEKAKA